MNLRYFSLAVLMIQLLIGSAFGQSSINNAALPAVASQTLDASAMDDVGQQSELIGEVQPVRKVALSFKVTGRLISVPYFAGAAVKANEIIATLDPRDFDLTVAQAEGALEATKAKLRQLETGSRPEEKRAAEENLKQSQANWENAQAEVERTRGLFKAGAVSRQVLDSAESRVKVTRAQFEAVREQKAIVDKGPRIEDKDGARATIRQLESTVSLARLQKEYAGLSAPFPGLIAMRHLDEGAYVTPASPVYTIVQVDPVIVAVDCPERLLVQLAAGMKATVVIDALPGRSFDGILERVPAVIDSKTRCARAEIFVQNPDGQLKPGMFARARFSSSKDR